MPKQDPILNGVQPVNQPRKKKGRPRKNAPKTLKEQAAQRHQTVLHSPQEASHELMGLGTVDPEIIEKQIALGLGLWHPDNVDQIPLEQLKADVEKLKKQALKSKPSPITAKTIFSGDIKLPSDFYDGPSPPSSLNTVDAYVSEASVGLSNENQIRLVNEDGEEVESKNIAVSFEQAPVSSSMSGISNFVPLHKVISGMSEKITQDSQYHTDRCVAYVDYLNWVVQKLEESQVTGNKYDKQLKMYESGKAIYEHALQLYRDQAAYENSLTPMHLKAIEQEERIQFLEAKLKESYSEPN